MTQPNNIFIEYTPRFKKNLKLLVKKYPSIRKDLQGVIDALAQGNILGDQIPGCRYPLFKIRIKNSDTNKGKSGGYRCIYYLKTPKRIILVTLYSKLEQGDITRRELRVFLREYS